MPENQEHIDLRSEEVQEILTRVPSWMIRRGISLIFVLIIGVLTLSYFIKYPDVIEGTVRLSSLTPPARLVSKTDGQIEYVHVKDNQWVERGDVLAQIKNPLSPAAVEYLKLVVEKVELGVENEFKELSFDKTDYLFGNAQAAYNSLVQAVNNYRVKVNNAQLMKRKSILQKQIANYKRLLDIDRKQLAYAQEKLERQEQKYKANKRLYDQGILAKMEFFQFEDEYNLSKTELEERKKSEVQNAITVTDYERQLNEIDIDFYTQQAELTKNIELNLNTIRNEIANWQESYQIIAPLSGKVNLLQQLTPHQFVKSSTPLFAIIPKSAETYIGYVELDKKGYGKVEKGQKVQLKFDNFPANEYGRVEGIVDQIAIIPNEDKYRVKVVLPNGLITAYNQELSYTPDMSGKATIITEDLRIIERIFHQFSQLFNR